MVKVLSVLGMAECHRRSSDLQDGQAKLGAAGQPEAVHRGG